ncbi:MAG: D-glycero-beta-D-manno-heptose 1-phosphate adenylyltransferase [Planctomycetota bacterium]
MSLADVVRNLGSPKILVVGDLVLDRYVFGTVSRISPEAPIPVLKAEEEQYRLGCAGSAARNLEVLGAEVFLAGYVGQGDYAEHLLGLTADLGIDTSGVHRVADRLTFRKTRLIATIAGKGVGGQQMMRVDREDLCPFAPDDESKLTVAALSIVEKVDLVVLSDYAKGTLTPPLIRAVIDAAKARDIPVLVDPKPPEYERYRGATAITPNRLEAQAHVGYEIDDLAKARTAGEQIRKDLDLEAVLVTLDKDGIYVSTDTGGEGAYPIVPREIFDVTGAGDVVIAVLAMAMAAGTGYADAVRIANIASGIAIGKLGVVPVSREEILESLHEAGRTRAGRKRLPLEDLVEVLEARRQRGEKIVFTNGCFDLLHSGHIRLLTTARTEGDALVVGLNSDASIRRLKGDDRPVREEADRVQVLSELESVDHIIVFDGDTPLPEIETIRPDVLVKGEDWRDKGVVGREVVEANGGRVYLVPLIPGLSSTRLIEKMKDH